MIHDVIETPRLVLKPLTYGQLVKYINADNSLETELKLKATSRIIPVELKKALEQVILPHVANTKSNYLFSTLWTMISKDENTMVGDLCFVGEPDPDGEVEIGYGTYEEFRDRGFMTEALSGMVKWAFKQPNVKSIFAATEKSNVASCSILKKNGFIKCWENDTMFNWRLKIR